MAKLSLTKLERHPYAAAGMLRREGMIVVGHCGDRLETYGTRRRKEP